METYPGLQYLDGFPEVNFKRVNKLEWFLCTCRDEFLRNFVQIKVAIRADVVRGTYEKVAVISGSSCLL